MPLTLPPQTLLTPIENNDLVTLTTATQTSGTPNPHILDELLAQAIGQNATKIIPYLVSLGASPLSDPPSNLLYKSTTFTSFQCLVENGLVNINTDLDPVGTFLILAVQRNNKSHVKFSLLNGADPNLGTLVFRWSALATAAE